MLKDLLKLRGDLKVTIWDESGAVKEELEEHNLIVNAGLNFICDRMEGVSQAVMSHMGVGAGTTAANPVDTDLESQISTRHLLANTVVSANTIEYTATFAAGENTGAITEAAIFNASTAGTMLCRTVFAVVNKDVNDTMGITWTITLTAS